MARLVAGSGFALDFDENRVNGNAVRDAFTMSGAGRTLASGADTLTIDRTAEGGRFHRTQLDYAGAGGAGRFTGLRDYDAGGALRYAVEGMDFTLSASALDSVGTNVFASIGEIAGGGGDDVWYMGVPGSRRFDGGAGTDRVIYGADPRRYVLRDGAYQAETPIIVALGPDVYGAASRGALDILVNVELVTIDGRTTPIAAAALDGLTYLASNPDLAAAFGTDLGAAARHYAGWGRNEGRATASFRPLSYAAANPDLAAAFGTDAAALTTHYVRHGWREGRLTTAIEPYAYLAANPDLAAAFGTDAAAALRHYDAHGRNEGRRTAFDSAAYLAVNPDVAAVLGTDPAVAARHYVEYGRFEGRRLAPGRGDAKDPPPIAKAAADALVARGVVTGTTGGDTLNGTVVTDQFGAQTVQDDWIDGLAGIDTFVLTQAVGLYGFALDADWRLVVTGPDGRDTLTGVELVQATDGLFNVATLMSLSAPSTSGMTPSADATTGDDYLVGTPWANTMGGNLGNDTLEGLESGDQLFGHGGADVLLGGDGNDSLYGGAENDRLYGGNGNDTLEGDTTQTSSHDLLDGGTGDDSLYGGKGNDLLFGSFGQDTLTGASGNDTLQGGDGADYVVGDQITNRYAPMLAISGETYDDALFGDTGNDVLLGALGADLLEGGGGSDRFVIANSNESTVTAPDVILDFGGPQVAAAALAGFANYTTRGSDRDLIDLSEINAIDGMPTNREFTFIGAAGFTAAGQLRYQQDGAATVIEGNVNGDLAADFRIRVNLVNYQFTMYDFVL